jgi:hypothetical protein
MLGLGWTYFSLRTEGGWAGLFDGVQNYPVFARREGQPKYARDGEGVHVLF